MSHTVHCDSCGDRERAGMMRDGECRDCRGVGRPEPLSRSGYVSPDDVERRGEAIALAEERSRHRVVAGAGGQR